MKRIIVFGMWCAMLSCGLFSLWQYGRHEHAKGYQQGRIDERWEKLYRLEAWLRRENIYRGPLKVMEPNSVVSDCIFFVMPEEAALDVNEAATGPLIQGCVFAGDIERGEAGENESDLNP